MEFMFLAKLVSATIIIYDSFIVLVTVSTIIIYDCTVIMIVNYYCKTFIIQATGQIMLKRGC